MYGNVGDKYIQIKEINKRGFKLSNIGEQYTIQEYYSVPHGFTSIKCNDVLLFIPDILFEKCFVRREVYNRYVKTGDNLLVHVDGEFREYKVTWVESIGAGTDFVKLSLESCD